MPFSSAPNGNRVELASDASQEWVLDTGTSTPVMVVDLDVMTKNVDAMVGDCRRHNVALVPHAKTHRTPEIGRLQLSRGCTGLSVARVAELEGFARVGTPYLVYTTPVLDKSKLARVAAVGTQARVVVAVDSKAGAQAVAAAFAAEDLEAEVALVIDSGQHRDGVDAGQAAALADEIQTIGGARLSMVLTHEGHTYAARDRDDLRRLSAQSSDAMRHAATAVSERVGYDVTVSMGASADARIAAATAGISQLRPGIFAFNDVGQIALGNATTEECAARVLATVVSAPEAGRAFIDAGSKALGREHALTAMAGDWSAYGIIVGRPGWRLTALSEEHGWLSWHGTGSPSPLRLGERVQIIPNHVCLAFFGATEVVSVSGGVERAKWTTIVG